MIYRGFNITPDNFMGYSLIDRKGQWCFSMTSVKKIKEEVDEILNN